MVILQKIIAFIEWILIALGLLVPSHSFSEAAFVAAVNAKDTAVLESMVCKNIKDNYSDLSERLTEFCDLVEELTGGELAEYSYRMWGSFSQNYDPIYNATFPCFEFGEPYSYGEGYTRPRYEIIIDWYFVYGRSFEDTGIHWLAIYDHSAHDGEGESLFSIATTDHYYYDG